MSEEKVSEVTKVAEEKKVVDPFIAGFYESMAKTNTEKITKEIMEDLSEDSDDSDDFDVESGDEDSEDRPWWPRLLSSESRPLNKVRLTPWGEDTFVICLL
jgi:hypothetical protein